MDRRRRGGMFRPLPLWDQRPGFFVGFAFTLLLILGILFWYLLFDMDTPEAGKIVTVEIIVNLIPALIIACAIGLCNCRFITRMVMKKPLQTEPRVQLVTLSRLYFILVLPLLLIAAAVEAFVTPHIMALFL